MPRQEIIATSLLYSLRYLNTIPHPLLKNLAFFLFNIRWNYNESFGERIPEPCGKALKVLLVCPNQIPRLGVSFDRSTESSYIARYSSFTVSAGISGYLEVSRNSGRRGKMEDTLKIVALVVVLLAGPPLVTLLGSMIARRLRRC